MTSSPVSPKYQEGPEMTSPGITLGYSGLSTNFWADMGARVILGEAPEPRVRPTWITWMEAQRQAHPSGWFTSHIQLLLARGGGGGGGTEE